MSYNVSLKTINDTEKTSWVFYTEEDLIKFLVKLKDGFTIFEGKILKNGYSDLSNLQIIEKNYDWVDGENNPAYFFPYPIDSTLSFENRAGTYQSVYESLSGFDPYEVDITEEYVRKYIIENQKPYFVDSCSYDSNTWILYINTFEIPFQRYSNNTTILEHISTSKKNTEVTFYNIQENKSWNDSLENDASFYSARKHINKRIQEKVPIKEFIRVWRQALICQYLGK